MPTLAAGSSPSLKQIAGAAVVILGVAATIAASAPPSNFVSIFAPRSGWVAPNASSCWLDIHPSGGGNDASEEAAAGRAFNSSFSGIRPADVAAGRYAECSHVGDWISP